MEIIIKKGKYVEIWYNTDNIKCCVSEMYPIVLLTNIKQTYDQIGMIKK